VIANPIVEQLILAGPTREVAMEMFTLEVEDEEQQDVYRHVRGGTPYEFGTIRVGPERPFAANRFRAYVTWMPTGKAGR
jgi:hypothetical protein